jgi:hypothetical protein
MHAILNCWTGFWTGFKDAKSTRTAPASPHSPALPDAAYAAADACGVTGIEVPTRSNRYSSSIVGLSTSEIGHIAKGEVQRSCDRVVHTSSQMPITGAQKPIMNWKELGILKSLLERYSTVCMKPVSKSANRNRVWQKIAQLKIHIAVV